jgi:NADPH:quinone reductase-like Zn-dependent oxidoreductase
MRAMAIDRFGGPEELKLRDLPVPTIGPDEVLIEVAAAGVGVWDGAERAGKMAQITPESAKRFPRVLGADGAGTIAAVGANVRDFREGDEVYAYNFFNPKGGFYAEYAAVPADWTARIPKGLDMEQAGALAVTGVTALRGLADTLALKALQRLLVFGASGGVGNPAVQLAKAMGATVLAVVSDAEGVAVAKQAGADVVANSKTDDLAGAIKAFAPGGLDAVLTFVNGPGLDAAIAAVRDGGRVAYPHGVQPEPRGRAGVQVIGYDGTPDRQVFDELNALIGRRPFSVHISRRFPLAAAAQAHQALTQRHLGRMILTVA